MIVSAACCHASCFLFSVSSSRTRQYFICICMSVLVYQVCTCQLSAAVLGVVYMSVVRQANGRWSPSVGLSVLCFDLLPGPCVRIICSFKLFCSSITHQYSVGCHIERFEPAIYQYIEISNFLDASIVCTVVVRQQIASVEERHCSSTMESAI